MSAGAHVRITGRVPQRASRGAAGLDLMADIDGPIRIEPGARRLIHTGTRIEIPSGHAGWITPRSGLAMKQGITVLNAPGLIDSDYRGEIGVILINLGTVPVWIKEGERIAQLTIAPVSRPLIDVVRESELSETDRGDRGFGSTGRV